MEVNHLSHFYLTDLLIDSLASKARIINVSSMAHKFSSITEEELTTEIGMAKFLNCTKDQFSSMGIYGNAKLANVMFAQGLAEYFTKNGKDAKAASLHPGAVRSNFISRSHSLGDFFARIF